MAFLEAHRFKLISQKVEQRQLYFSQEGNTLLEELNYSILIRFVSVLYCLWEYRSHDFLMTLFLRNNHRLICWPSWIRTSLRVLRRSSRSNFYDFSTAFTFWSISWSLLCLNSLIQISLSSLDIVDGLLASRQIQSLRPHFTLKLSFSSKSIFLVEVRLAR